MYNVFLFIFMNTESVPSILRTVYITDKLAVSCFIHLLNTPQASECRFQVAGEALWGNYSIHLVPLRAGTCARPQRGRSGAGTGPRRAAVVADSGYTLIL